ncbi:MAG TPA: NAD(P)H-hydrate dehydratase, partial [Phenylobacterium sp.]|nr:NAD(P)H-hydrate dehydratase [Phenylobacterium sp.]
MPDPLTPELLRRHPLPPLGVQADKEARGRVLIVGGSRQAPGALKLAAEAALRAGCGKVQLAAPAGIAPG